MNVYKKKKKTQSGLLLKSKTRSYFKYGCASMRLEFDSKGFVFLYRGFILPEYLN